MTAPSEHRTPVQRAKAVVAGDAVAPRIYEMLAETNRLAARLAALEQAYTESERDRERWADLESAVPGLLHHLSVTSGALRRLRRDVTSLESEQAVDRATAEALATAVHELWDHLRVVRAEVLHEVRAAAGATAALPAVEPKVAHPERLAELEAAGPLRVNLGCGHLALDGHVNVDMRPLPTVDVVAALDHLPFEPGSLAAITSAHVLEHFTVEALRRTLLPYWRDLLRPGGELVAVVPDGAAMAAALAEGRCSFEDYAAVVMGGQEYEGDFHLSVFSAESLAALLTGCGFVDVEVVATARPLDICLEMELRARRPT